MELNDNTDTANKPFETMGWAGYVGHVGKGSRIHNGGEDMAAVGRYNINLDLIVIGWTGVECTDLVKDTVKWRTAVKEVMKV